MAAIYPFRALRPTPESAVRVAAVPYDVVSVDEARALAAGNPLSFLHVSRAEIDLPDGNEGTDPYADRVYEEAAARFAELKRSAPLIREEAPSLYCYRLRLGSHEQTGVAGCYSLDEYDRDVIKKHERTRRDKEDDRTRHLIALGAQTGPVFLTYRASAEVDAIVGRVVRDAPLFDFSAADEVRHTVWAVGGRERQELVDAFARIRSLYIADGHHRAASAARARQQARSTDADTFLAVAFPDDQVQILPYNRVVKDLAGHSPESFLRALGAEFVVTDGPSAPARKGEMSMYLAGRWFTVGVGIVDRGSGERLRPLPSAAPAAAVGVGPHGVEGMLRGSSEPQPSTSASDVISALDVSVLQERILGPLLRIGDVRTDKRIDFVGGARGPTALARLVDAGKAAVGFSMFPVSVADLIAVADAGGIMPPKSTWFEPKLRDGLLIHLI